MPTAWADVEPGSDPLVLAIGCTPPEYEIVKQIPGCNIGKDYIWRVPLTWASWNAMMCAFQRQGITQFPPLQQWVAEAQLQFAAQWADRNALDATDGDLRGWMEDKDRLPTSRPAGSDGLTAPQRGGVQYLLNWRRCILGDDRGNGKTPSLIRALQWLHEAGEGFPALVICPDGALLSWQRKLADWAPELRTVIIGTSVAKRRSAIKQLRDGEYDVGLIVWQNVRYHTRLAPYPGQGMVACDRHGGETGKSEAACEKCLKDFNFPEGDPDHPDGSTWLRTVIPDEAHRLADPHSKQSRAVWWLMHHCENTWPTTGTLTVNSVADLWSIDHGINPRAFPSRMRWLDLFAVKDFAFMGKGEVILDLREDNAPTFNAIQMPMFRRVPREIARAGEPAMAEIEFRYPPMVPRQQRLYDQIAKLGLAEIEPGQTLVPGSAITEFTRLLQLATCTIYTEDIEDPRSGFPKQDVKLCLPSNKVDDLLEFLADNPGQWIVALTHPGVIDLAADKLKEQHITWAKIIGGMPTVDKDTAQQRFQSGQVRLIFISSAGGESIDLQAAEGIYWMEPDPRFVGREQKTGRGDRFGRTTALRQVWALSPGTVDIRIYQLGLIKEARHDQVTQDARMLRWLMDVAPGETVPGDDHDRTVRRTS